MSKVQVFDQSGKKIKEKNAPKEIASYPERLFNIALIRGREPRIQKHVEKSEAAAANPGGKRVQAGPEQEVSGLHCGEAVERPLALCPRITPKSFLKRPEEMR
jgi:hypothetical protein